MNLTKEQKLIVESSGNLIIEARAGTGKTTTLIEYSKHNQNKRKLYLAFNKSISEEAKVKFKKEKVKNIDIYTAHGLAFSHVIKELNYKLGYSLTPYSLVKTLKLKNFGEESKNISHAIRMFDSYCNSNIISLDSFDYLSVLDSDVAKRYYEDRKKIINNIVKTIWEHMESKTMDCTHSWYLKYFQLLNKKLPYDVIMLDEAQDANPVILDIFNNQDCIKIAVGDNYQAIYGWRGAINAMSQLPYPKLYLSESFRFPQNIADLALGVLSFKENYDSSFDISKVKLIGKGNQKEIKTKAVISRSNLSLLLELYYNKDTYKKPYIEGGIDTLTQTNSGIKFIDIYYFLKNKKNMVKNQFLLNFSNSTDLCNYFQDIDDSAVVQIVDFLKDLKVDFKDILEYLENCAVTNVNDADYVFSTIHKAKGNEWDEVSIIGSHIDSNFPYSVPLINKSNNRYYTQDELSYLKTKYNEELNIYYVAVTRAKVKLNHNLSWISSNDFTNNSKTEILLNEPVENIENNLQKELFDKSNDLFNSEFKNVKTNYKIQILTKLLEELKNKDKEIE